MKIILFQPQIPQNTGNIVRSCSVTGTDLALIKPLGFSTQNRHLKRAGLDYWEGVSVEELDDLQAYLETLCPPFFFFSSKASQCYTEAPYTQDSELIFGSETNGLPPYFFQKYPERFFKIPMVEGTRCLNLATSVGIVLYHALYMTKSFQTHFLPKREKRKESAALITAEEASGK